MFLPTAYAALPNPTEFFEDLAERADARVESLTMELLAAEPEPEEEMARMQRLERARRTAESIVMEQEVYLPPEIGLEQTDLPMDLPQT
jgi:hypothetical protein